MHVLTSFKQHKRGWVGRSVAIFLAMIARYFIDITNISMERYNANLEVPLLKMNNCYPGRELNFQNVIIMHEN
jgi:hypothetical protein